MKQQTLISGRWVQTAPLVVTDPERPKLRGSQPQAVRALKDKKHVILNAPTGWGKSLVIITLLLYKLLRNKELRGIIAVPQTLIGRGFVNHWALKIPGIRKLVDWVVGHNLCDEQANDTVVTLINFLKGNREELADRVLICTHATLAKCYRQLQKKKQLSLLRNVVLWIDEAHHVMNAQVEGQKDTISNAIGNLVKYCVRYGNHVGLATATFMRGDMRHILPDEMAEAFTRFDVPYDDYFKTMQPVESFEFNVICGDKLKAIGSLFKKTKPTIIYLAKRQSRYAGRCKYQEVRQIIKVLEKRRRQKARREGPVTRIGRLRVLDLVHEKGRSARKDYLNNGGQVDVIIALDTCKEGFDWPEAERSIILGERHSVPEMIQMIGRLFRRCEGKTHAEVHQVLPVAAPNTRAFKEQCNSTLTVLFAAMLLEDVFLPIPLKGNRTRLVRITPDTSAWQALMRDFLVAASHGYEESWRMAPSILKKHGVPESDWRRVWNKLWQRCALVSRKRKGLRLDVPFEVLKKTDLVDGVLMLASGLCGAMTFTELRRVIGRGNRTPKERVIEAEQLAIDCKGILPNHGWLQKNGYYGINYAMLQYPGLFSHIPQDRKKGLPAKERIPEAEQLAKDHGGMLPSGSWLKKNGHSALYHAMMRHPKLFAHIPRSHHRMSIEERIPEAEQLAKDHDGILPHPAWLQKNGYNTLYCVIKKYPGMFSRIPQERKQVYRVRERVPEAEQLAKDHSGMLPSGTWLKKNGYSALVDAKTRYPKLFSHIPQEYKKGPPAKERVPEAEQLARDHGGVLPTPTWLQKNGYTHIYTAIWRHPHLFAHIPKDSRKGLSPEERVPEAEQLARKRGGVVPNATWLIANGHRALYYAMMRHPKLFAHIPRHRGRAA